MFASRRSPFFWSRRRMRYSIGAAAGLAAATAVATAAAVYFFDPESGRRRRALLRDQAVRDGVLHVGDLARFKASIEADA